MVFTIALLGHGLTQMLCNLSLLPAGNDLLHVTSHLLSSVIAQMHMVLMEPTGKCR